MTFDDFAAKYGYNARRDYLCDLLKTELDAIQANGWPFGCYVFGSMVKEPLKDHPGDIDVLLSIALPGAGRWKRIATTKEIQILVQQTGPTFEPEKTPPISPASVLTVQQMIAAFNALPANVASGIQITGSGSDLVEVTL